MKKRIVVLIMLLCLLVVTPALAQNPNRNANLRQRIELAKLNMIRQELQLDEATFARFQPVFINYERKIENLDFRNQNYLLNANSDSLSTQEADQLIAAQWMRSKQLINIRERFYMEFRKILTAQQVIKLYQSEAAIRKKVQTEVLKRRAAY